MTKPSRPGINSTDKVKNRYKKIITVTMIIKPIWLQSRENKLDHIKIIYGLLTVKPPARPDKTQTVME